MSQHNRYDHYVVIETHQLKPGQSFYASGDEVFCQARIEAWKEDRGWPARTRYTLGSGTSHVVVDTEEEGYEPHSSDRYVIVPRAEMVIKQPYLRGAEFKSHLKAETQALNNGKWPWPDRALSSCFWWELTKSGAGYPAGSFAPSGSYFIIDTRRHLAPLQTGQNNNTAIGFNAVSVKPAKPTDKEIVTAWLATQRWLESDRRGVSPHGHEWKSATGPLEAIFIGEIRVTVAECRAAWSRELKRYGDEQIARARLPCQGTLPEDL